MVVEQEGEGDLKVWQCFIDGNLHLRSARLVEMRGWKIVAEVEMVACW